MGTNIPTAKGGGAVVTDATLSGNGSAGSPLSVPAGLFGADTVIQLPNSTSAQVSALELITSLTTNTAGSEVSKFLMKLLSTGAQVSAFSFEPSELVTDSGALTTWNWIMKYNGTAVASIGFNSVGQLLLVATQAAGGLFMGVGTPGQAASGLTVSVNNDFGLTVGGAVQITQFTNIASASTLVVPAGRTSSGAVAAGNSGNVTGSVMVNLIDSTWWTRGSEINLMFTAGTMLKHNQAASGNALPMLLKGSVDATVPANGRIKLVLLGANSGAGPNFWVDFTGVISP